MPPPMTPSLGLGPRFLPGGLPEARGVVNGALG